MHKAFANRDQDWLDIRGILKRNRQKLNQTQILEELRPLVELKEEPEIIQHLERMFAST